MSTNTLQVSDLEKICTQKTVLADYPHAESVIKNILVYEGNTLCSLTTPEKIQQLKRELNRALKDGPGVIMIKQFCADRKLLEEVNNTFYHIIEEETNAVKGSSTKGDHFAKGSPNARIWNVFEKMLYANPEQFFSYYSNPLYALVAEAWLGPGYQITAQVNLVRPGSDAQVAHRDYHLGFQDSAVIEEYPLNVQISSQFLTLQGALAHCDMPLESGPTLLLPFSQSYDYGYLAMRRPEFVEFFNHHHVQVELASGDAVFFSPALFHAAGSNHSQDINRMVNLFQISSAFGKPMEKVNLVAMSKKIYPFLLAMIKANPELLTSLEMNTIIKAVANGYPFPHNLDIMQPKKGSITPPTDQEILRNALHQQISTEDFSMKLDVNQVH